MSDETILWRRLDAPGHDSARLHFHRGRWRLSGTAVFAEDRRPSRLDYCVTCDTKWRTKSATVRGWIGGDAVDVSLLVDSSGRWSFNGKAVLDCSGCVDVDLSFTPATNLLPIRRLALAPGAEARVVAAWLRMPAPSLESLEQRYRRLDETHYHYESNGGRFLAELRVNAHGFVIDYPPNWTAEI